MHSPPGPPVPCSAMLRRRARRTYGGSRALMATLLRVGLADEALQALGIAQLTVGDRVELAVELVQGFGFAGDAVLGDPEQRRGAERADFRLDTRRRATAREIAA